MMISAVDDWKRWALFTVPEGGEWNSGTIALLGDAVHAMLPFAAQGAGMAIEDAAVLAKVMSEGTMETPSPLGALAPVISARVGITSQNASGKSLLRT